MQRLSGQCEWFWCPRCGSIKDTAAKEPFGNETPKLVDRVRWFLDELGSTENEMARLAGITESCLLPKER
jgi:hypothetical protein